LPIFDFQLVAAEFDMADNCYSKVTVCVYKTL